MILSGDNIEKVRKYLEDPDYVVLLNNTHISFLYEAKQGVFFCYEAVDVPDFGYPYGAEADIAVFKRIALD